MFVADFIGSPPMNFLDFEAGCRAALRSVAIEDATVVVPEVHEEVPAARWCWACGPSTSASPTSPAYRGEVFGVEYLGTTQIVTLVTPCGRVKARLSSDVPVRVGERGRPHVSARKAVALRQVDRQRDPHRAARRRSRSGRPSMAEMVLDSVSKSFRRDRSRQAITTCR